MWTLGVQAFFPIIMNPSRQTSISTGSSCCSHCCIVQVTSCYPKETHDFAPELINLLDTHYAVLDPALRRGLVKALILLRNKGQVRT